MADGAAAPRVGPTPPLPGRSSGEEEKKEKERERESGGWGGGRMDKNGLKISRSLCGSARFYGVTAF